jgi:hypothetical protein
MGKPFGEWRSEEATRRAATYKVDPPMPHPPEDVDMTVTEWEQLSPGFRRAITREFSPAPEAAKTEEATETRRDRKDHRDAIETAAKKRL